MHACAAAGASFLVAVLWFDLMFDVQVRGHAGAMLPDEVLASIRAYYRRVTTDAQPMNRLITAVMLLTVAALTAEIALRPADRLIGAVSLAAALGGIGLAAVRTVRNAVRLGGGADTPEIQSGLARGVLRDYLICLAAMILVAVLQLATAPR